MKKRRLYVQLGRAGDILNILPLLKRDFDQTGVQPFLMVQRDYASLIDGISYARPILWAGEFYDVVPALMCAEKMASEKDLQVICTQIYGKGMVAQETCSSFLRQSWANVPAAPAWGSLPLVFDRRDPSREQAIVKRLVNTDKKYIVVSTAGVSSPFNHSEELKRQMREDLPDHEIVDVSGFHADRFFDMLGLLEGAGALVTIDSGLLHLAHAVPALPVIAFITRDPSAWHGSAARPQQVYRFYYDEAPDCLCVIPATLKAFKSFPRNRIFHAWSHFADEMDAETTRRMNFAKRTWTEEAERTKVGTQWVEVEFRRKDATRSSGDAPILDPRPMPYWKDLIQSVIDRHNPAPWDIIALTNSDVAFCPGITGWINETVGRHLCAFTHRWDFYHPMTEPLANEAQVQQGHWYAGSDAFFFTIGWWKDHGHEYPDMILGREQNDEVLRQLIKRHGGLEIPHAIYHEKHPSFWEHHGNRENNSGNIHNRKLARNWMRTRGYGPNDPEWWKLPKR